MSTDTTIDRRTDRDEIVAVTVRYCWALDHQRWGDLDQVFAPDSVSDYGSDARYIGPKQVGEFCAAVVALSGIDPSQHIVVNHDVQIDGDIATCRTQYQSHYVLRPTPGNPEPPVMDIGGSYLDAFVRTPDGWRISHRVARGTWRMGEAAAPAPAAPTTAFVVAGWLDVEPGRQEEVVAAASELMAAASEQEPGCLDLAITEDRTVDGRVRVYSRWLSEGDFLGHMDTEHQKAFRRALKGVSVKEHKVRRYVVSEETPVLAWSLPLEAAV